MLHFHGRRSAHNIGLSLYRKTVGLVGMGDCAREVALKFYHASKCRILVYSPTSPRTRWTAESTTPNEPVIPHARVNSLEELLKESDVVSLHCPAVPDTFKMMSDKQFEIMKDSAIFLNLGRGELVDEEALFRACKNRKIFGAGVWLDDSALSGFAVLTVVYFARSGLLRCRTGYISNVRRHTFHSGQRCRLTSRRSNNA